MFAGIYAKKDGYVLSMEDRDGYYPYPEGQELLEYEKAQLLPKTLPDFSLNFLDYLLGFSLWWIILGALIWSFISHLLKKFVNRPEEPSSQGTEEQPPVEDTTSETQPDPESKETKE